MADSTLIHTELTVVQLNRSLSGYRVVREVGHGSMGVVYEAHQESVGRRVAIKVLPPNMALRDRTVKRFLREAEAMGRLSHHNIVDIHEVRSLGSLHYFSMQFVEGPPLDRVLKAGPLAVADVLTIGFEVASALAHAHARGVLHRDVKPSNLLRDGERVVLTDFGLARPIDHEEAGSMTESGDLVGTPLYMSPEQISGEGEKTDARSDVWGLGATLYELLTQRPPFLGSNAQAILNSILHKDPPLLRKVRDDVPRDLEAVVLKCLEKDVGNRYATAAALAEDLKAIQEGRPVSARTPRFFDPAVRWVRRHPAEALVGVALLAVAGVLASKWWGSAASLATVSSEKEAAERANEDLQRAMSLSSARAELLQAQTQWTTGGVGEKAEAFDRVESLALTFQDRYPQIASEAIEVFGRWGHEAAQTKWTKDVQVLYVQYLQLNPTTLVVSSDMFFAWMRQSSPAQFESMVRENEQAVIDHIERRIIARQDPGAALQWRAALFTGLGRFDEALHFDAERSRLDPRDPLPWIDAARLHRKVSAIRRDAGDMRGWEMLLLRSISSVKKARELAVLGARRESLVAALIERSRALIDLGQPEAALPDLRLALVQEPGNAAALSLQRFAERNIEELALEREPSPVATQPASGKSMAEAESEFLKRTQGLRTAGKGLQSVYRGLRDLLVAPAGEARPEAGAPAPTEAGAPASDKQDR